MPTPNDSDVPFDSDIRVGRMLAEVLSAVRQGEQIDRSLLEARYPGCGEELWTNLQLARQLGRSQPSVASLLRRGLLQPATDDGWQAQLGPFKIAGVLGQGGMGIVLRAYEPQLNRWVAVKLLRPELAGDGTALRRFVQEAQAAARLQHPNIASIYQVGDECGTNYFAMELVSGPSLAEILREVGPFGASDCRRFAQQVLAGLSAAHAANLIHRDLKPSNILLDEARTLAKIVDFGLARVVDAHTRITLPESVFGTPEYMSPEQIATPGEVDHRTDLYSAGVTLYEMLTGRPPFPRSSPSAVAHAIVYDEPRPVCDLNPEADPVLATLAMRLMAKRPQDRFASATEALAALETNRPIRVRSPRRAAARRARRIALGIAVTLVAVAILRSQSLRSIFAPADLNHGTARPPITSVEIERQNGARTGTILARFGDDPTPRTFLRLPREAGHLNCVTLIGDDGSGEPVVVWGAARPSNSATLVAYDREARERWTMDLAPSVAWPGETMSPYWHCLGLTKADVDSEPGDELIISANAFGGYPSRVSVISPRSRDILRTFWHPGNLNAAVAVRDFFGPEKPALVVWGTNNKLDSVDETRPGEPPSTLYDLVSVVAVLDPRNMDGIAPPFAGGLGDIPAATPYAYVFLDAAISSSHDAAIPGDANRRVLRPDEIARVTQVQEASYPNKDGRGPFFSVDFEGETTDRKATWIVDRHLRLVEPIRRRSDEQAEQFWRERWRPIIQEGTNLGR